MVAPLTTVLLLINSSRHFLFFNDFQSLFTLLLYTHLWPMLYLLILDLENFQEVKLLSNVCLFFHLHILHSFFILSSIFNHSVEITEFYSFKRGPVILRTPADPSGPRGPLAELYFF